MGQLVSRVTVARYGQIPTQNLAWKDLLEVRNAVDLKLRSPTCACQHPRVRRQGAKPPDSCGDIIWQKESRSKGWWFYRHCGGQLDRGQAAGGIRRQSIASTGA
jgi:hypothetical protein